MSNKLYFKIYLVNSTI